MTTRVLIAAWGLTMFAGSAVLHGGSVDIPASRDNTLIEMPLPDIYNSNGAGDHFFAGQMALGLNRRGVIAFDVAAALPPGALVTNATLRLNMSRTNPFGTAADISMHRLNVDWGEAGSDALKEEGGGVPAEPGDATWDHTSFDSVFWSNPGADGDFDVTASATTLVDAEALYFWSSPQLVADVQDMLDNPTGNYGWILIGDESQDTTTKRFDSRTNPVAGVQPVLQIEFTSEVPTVSQWGLLSLTTLLLAAGAWLISRRRMEVINT